MDPEEVVPEWVDGDLPHSLRLIGHREHLRCASRDRLGVSRISVVQLK